MRMCWKGAHEGWHGLGGKVSGYFLSQLPPPHHLLFSEEEDSVLFFNE